MAAGSSKEDRDSRQEGDCTSETREKEILGSKNVGVNPKCSEDVWFNAQTLIQGRGIVNLGMKTETLVP